MVSFCSWLLVYIYMCVCAFACMYVSMRIFNLFMIPLRKIRLRAFVTDINNQLAWKCLKKTCLTAFVVDVADRLVDNEFNVKLTEDQVRIGLKRTFMYFPWFFILPPLLKSSQKFTFDGQMLFFFYYRKHPNTSLHLFVIDFTILNRFRTFRNFFFGENVILSPFLEIWYF